MKWKSNAKLVNSIFLLEDGSRGIQKSRESNNLRSHKVTKSQETDVLGPINHRPKMTTRSEGEQRAGSALSVIVAGPLKFHYEQNFIMKQKIESDDIVPWNMKVSKWTWKGAVGPMVQSRR